MQVSHTPATISASFDDPNLVSDAGLVPIMTLANDIGLSHLAQDWLSIPGDKGSKAGAKVASLIAGMVAGADSIDDMNQLRHGGNAHPVHQDLRPINPGIVSEVVYLRTRPPTRCGRLALPDRPGRPSPWTGASSR